MYSACLFCTADLGRNEVLEHFPVGRRLAYDERRGRLWVVCRKCERWNLTPLDARWEAIEEAERLYRGTRLRASSDQIGLARVGDGLELIRIGEPLRPELAAWRYGDQFGRRRRKHLIGTAAAVGAGVAAVAIGPALGLVSVGAVSPFLNVFNLGNLYYQSRWLVRVPLGGERALDARMGQMRAARLVARRDGGFEFEVPGETLPVAAPLRRWAAGTTTPSVRLRGEEAVRAAGGLLPRVNGAGGAARTVRDAVAMLEEYPEPTRLYAAVAHAAQKTFRAKMWQIGEEGTLTSLPMAARLALEMAAHEETERQALAGELALLEQAWRAAEEIAAIADELLLPDRVTRAVRALRAGAAREEAAAPRA